MNRWQIAFGVIGILASVLLLIFPPQIISDGVIEFRPFFEGYPVDWLRLFLWIVLALFVAALGIGLNKEEHS